MNEKGLIEQVLRIINANYSNIYVIDIPGDKVYTFGFTITNSLVIKETLSYTDFIEVAEKFVHKDDISAYFSHLSLNTLELESQKGNNETKFKYRKLSETGEYRYFVNIINYLPFENRKLIFMMSEDVNDRLVDSEEASLKLETKVNDYEKRLQKESDSISDAIIQVNTILEQGFTNDGVLMMKDMRGYINSVFNKASVEHPELNKAIINKLTTETSYKKPTILIVDDSSIIRNSLKKIFANNYNIMMAKDGLEAINIITENIINKNDTSSNIVGILLDLIMPNYDGFAVLDFFKNNNLFSRIPVAIISGDETKETRKRVYQYDIVDMLEKPFNTENIRRRISKIINLYMSGNNLQSIVALQNQELEKTDDNQERMPDILKHIIENIINSKEITRLKKFVRVMAIALASKHSKYNLDPVKIDNIVHGCAYYNIGAVAMSDDMVITSLSIKEEIGYGLTLVDYMINDEELKNVTKNIVKSCFEMHDGSGYPHNAMGNDIPIEAQITNLMVRITKQSKTKSLNSIIKAIVEKDYKKYNPDLINTLNEIKKELKTID